MQWINQLNNGTDGSNNRTFQYIIKREPKGIDYVPYAIMGATSQSKVQGYLLNSNNDNGKDKEHLIRSVLGYNYQTWEPLANQLYNGLQTNKYISVKTTKWGTSYNVPIRIYGTKKKSMVLITVWQVDKGSNIPRFITTKFDKRTIKNV